MFWYLEPRRHDSRVWQTDGWTYGTDSLTANATLLYVARSAWPKIQTDVVILNPVLDFQTVSSCRKWHPPQIHKRVSQRRTDPLDVGELFLKLIHLAAMFNHNLDDGWHHLCTFVFFTAVVVFILARLHSKISYHWQLVGDIFVLKIIPISAFSVCTTSNGPGSRTPMIWTDKNQGLNIHLY